MRAPTLTRVILAAGAAACLATWLFGARLPYFDYDDATQGIFVNDLTFLGSLDASFAGKTDPQDVYRKGFAAQRVSYSIPLSWAQRALRMPRWKVEELLRFAAVFFALAGCAFAALATKRGRSPFSQRSGIRGALPEKGDWPLFVPIALLAAHPSMALFARSGASFYVFAFAVFWLGTLASFRWIETGKPARAYLAALAAVLSLLNPYPPLSCWPLAAAVYAVWEKKSKAVVRDRHIYGAAAATLAGTLLITAVSAWSVGLSLTELLARQAAFRAARGSAVALSQLGVNPLDKLVKLVNQHVLSRVDRLGDASRDDSIWVLGGIQPIVLLWAAAAAFGLWIALRRRDESDRRVLAVTAVLLAVFFTVSFPEGRYALALLPCWAYFALRGAYALPLGQRAREAALGIALLLTAAGAEHAIQRTYVPNSLTAWAGYEGMTAAAPLAASLPDGGQGITMLMPYPVTPLKELRFRMVMPAGATWLPRQEAERILSTGGPEVRMCALDYADQPHRIQALQARGFARSAEFRGEASGRPMLFLMRAP